MYCSVCGEKAETESKYCTACGSALPVGSIVTEAPRPAEPVPIEKPKKEKKKKSKWKKWVILGIICFAMLVGALILLAVIFAAFKLTSAIRPYLGIIVLIQNLLGL